MLPAIEDKASSFHTNIFFLIFFFTRVSFRKSNGSQHVRNDSLKQSSGPVAGCEIYHCHMNNSVSLKTENTDHSIFVD